MSKQVPLCFYHSADLDGHCSGAVVYEATRAELVGINYGDPFPFERCEDREVVLIDFSLQPTERMAQLFETADRVLWIDHHKTAIGEFRERWPKGHDKVTAVLVASEGEHPKAACELAWVYFHPEEGITLPPAIELLSRYDTWDLDDQVLAFQFGMRMITETRPEVVPGLWRKLLAAGRANPMYIQILSNGAIALAVQRSENAKAVSMAFETELDGLKVVALNRGGCNSLVFDSWAGETPDAWAPFVWKGERRGGWTVSLYAAREGVDVGELARARGGGGHAGAAGFQCMVLPTCFLT